MEYSYLDTIIVDSSYRIVWRLGRHHHNIDGYWINEVTFEQQFALVRDGLFVSVKTHKEILACHKSGDILLGFLCGLIACILRIGSLLEWTYSNLGLCAVSTAAALYRRPRV